MSVASAPPGFDLYHLDPDALAALDLPDVAFPVRSGRAEEIFGGDTIRFGLVVDELDRYVAAYPETVDTYGPIIARLTHLAGTFEGTQGRPDTAARYFARGLSYAPESPRLNADLGFAYQLQGRTREAAAQYRRALALEPDNPLVLLLAARANHALGNDDIALAMLQACPADYWNDATFRDLYRSLGGDVPQIADGPNAAIAAERGGSQRLCSRCGADLDRDHRFCPACGHAISAEPGRSDRS